MLQHRCTTLAALLSVTLLVSAANAVSLTSVNQLDLTNVVKAYNFVTTADTSLTIGGVNFIGHNWSNGVAFSGLTASDVSGMSGAPLGAPAITLGGTLTDQANLSSVLNSTNYSNGSSPGASMSFSVAVPDGNYIVQYLAGTSANRSNEFLNASPLTSYGTFSGSGNFLLTGTATASGGTGLSLKVDYFASADGRPIISGLIVNQIIPPPPAPEPSSMLLLGLGALGLVRHTQRRKQQG